MFWNISKKKKEWVESTLSSLSIEEKIAQMICERATDVMNKNKPIEWLRQNPLGSLFVGSEIIHDATQESASIQECIKKANSSIQVPIAVCGDFEHGIGRNIAGYTHLPDPMALSATFDLKLAYEYGKIIAKEGRSIGLHWGFGPVADLNTNHCNFVTNTRSAGDNPEHVAVILRGLVKGMQENGMSACPKHFPGDGTDTRNQHIVTSLNLLTKEEWDQIHGKVFQSLIDVGAASIMIGHIGFPAYEPIDEIKGKFCPATASRKILTDLLRKEMGFKGIILTDALCMNGFISWGNYEERMLDALNAGIDVFLWPDAEKFTTLIKNALNAGRISMERIEESVRRILMFKAWLDIDMKKESVPLRKDALEANRETASIIAEKSVTLLRNREHTLPLKLSYGAKLLVITIPEGVEKAVKPLYHFVEKLKERGYEVTMGEISELHKLDTGSFDAVFLLCNSKPLYVKYPINDYSLWDFMVDKRIKNRILISFGTPYFLYETAEANNYINVYSDSRESVEAAIKALFGEIPFKGKSPVSMPYCFNFGDGIVLE